MSELIKIDEIKHASIDQLSQIHQLCFDKRGWDQYTCEKMLSLSDVYGYTISHDKKIMGFILLQRLANDADIITFCVLPDQRRNGFGRMLLDYTVHQAKEYHLKKISLEVSSDNRAAIELYSKLGFQEVSVRRNYYSAYTENARDALIMQALL